MSILCEDLREPADAEKLAHRIGEALSSPFALSTGELKVTASVGVAFAGSGQDVARRLLRDADSAMYEAKRGGGARHHLFDNKQAIVAADRLSFESDLRVALDQHALELAYQPIVRSSDGLVTGVEALLRWTRPDRGSVPAQAIVAAAERIGLIRELGAWGAGGGMPPARPVAAIRFVRRRCQCLGDAADASWLPRVRH